MASRRRATYLALLAVVVVVASVHERLEGPPVFPIDDAYITLHNALTLVRGSDASYGVPALVGATSVLHVVLVAVFARVLPGAVALELVAWLAVALYALALARLAFVSGSGWRVACLVTLAGLLLGDMPHELLNGLETGLTLGLVTLALGLAVSGPPLGLPIVCGLLPFARPELVVLVPLLVVARDGRRLVRDGLVALGVAAPWLLLLWATTGSPIPSSIAAKRLFFAEGCADLSTKLGVTLAQLWLFVTSLGVVSVAAVMLPWSRLGRACVAFAVVLVGAYCLEFPGALGHYEHRYLYPLVPMALFGALLWVRRRGSSSAAGVTVLALALFETAEHARDRWAYHESLRRFTREELAGVAEFVEHHTAPSDRILVHDAGYLSIATTRSLVDLVGLKTPASVPWHRELTWTTCGVRRPDAIAAIAAESQPRCLVVLDAWEMFFGIANALRVHGWRVDLMRGPPAHYLVYRIVAP